MGKRIDMEYNSLKGVTLGSSDMIKKYFATFTYLFQFCVFYFILQSFLIFFLGNTE